MKELRVGRGGETTLEIVALGSVGHEFESGTIRGGRLRPPAQSAKNISFGGW
jgi:hypothetical protein